MYSSLCPPGPGCVDTTKCFDADLDPKGATYDGCSSTTVSGRTCQVGHFLTKFLWQLYFKAWASTTPHSHGFVDKLGNDSNNCRNPDGEPGPWYKWQKSQQALTWKQARHIYKVLSWLTHFRCYTTDKDKRWELCPDLACLKEGTQHRVKQVVKLTIALLGGNPEVGNSEYINHQNCPPQLT